MNRPDRRPWTAQFMGGFQEADRDLTMEKVLLFFFASATVHVVAYVIRGSFSE